MSTISAGTTSTTTLIHSGDTTGSLVLKTNDTGSGGTTAVTIDTSQNVGIGTTSPSYKLDVLGIGRNYSSVTGTPAQSITENTGSGDAYVDLRSNSALKTRLYYDSTNLLVGLTAVPAIPIVFKTSDAERMRIDSSGRVMIGATSNAKGALLEVVGGGSSSATFAYFAKSGALAVSGVTTASNTWGIYTNNFVLAQEFDALSDARLKENIADLSLQKAWQFVNNVKSVTYNWKNDENKAERIGYIAQNVVAAGFDELVSTHPDDSVSAENIYGVDSPDKVALNMNYDQVIPILSLTIKDLKETIQEQQAFIQQLQADVAALKGI